MLTLQNIRKSYTVGNFTQEALKGISLKFRENEFVAILGSSGSGKTTCLNVIGGLDQYDSGDLIINGKSTKDFKDQDWDAYRNNSIGFIFQSYNLITHLSILTNVELGMTLSGVAKKEKHKKAQEVLEKVGLKEHMHKKPNQLSGGQMQRVAIARALANDPDIILADEPTGALDSMTSIQILKLIKEIAKDKLVIMVTHNSELAHSYADRIVQFKDGEIIDDSNPLNEEYTNINYKLKKTGMSFFTALKLSGMNIRTKKWRTLLTAFASSIGIIGIALILSLSNGFDQEINSFEAGTLSSFPIMISKQATIVDFDEMREKRKEINNVDTKKEQYPDVTVVYPYDSSANTMVHNNKFTNEYMDYIDNIDKNLISGISYTRLVGLNLLKSDGKTATLVKTESINFGSYPMSLTENDNSYLEENFDLLSGSFPKSMNDVLLVVDNRNRIDKDILEVLDMDYEAESIQFDDIIGYELKVILNNDYYTKNGDFFTINNPANLIDLYKDENAIPINISGIIRSKEENDFSLLEEGLAYSDKLTEYVIEQNKDSDIVLAQMDADYNVLTGEALDLDSDEGKLIRDNMLSYLGANGIPYIINIYPKDFNSKSVVLRYLDAFNEGKEKEDMIVYTDLASAISSLSENIMNAITLVLIAFAAISLVVSLIMIGIITYISVLERTKEIGVLRALGARKKDITRVFNAETFIIGTCSGVLGITIARLLLFPTNRIIEKAADLPNVAKMNPVHAVILVIISVTLTVLGGWLPAKMAAKKDPVEALRAE
ncbi:MAG: sulfate transporter ATP-binding protein [Anaerocolumna sp.]|jgi:putative ABC transport system permease protein|nr:sulfate transporter ATP-binding protein [Anaerocolumna sp.]